MTENYTPFQKDLKAGKLCVMCYKELNEDETSVYSCKKCYNKYAFWTISEKNTKLRNDLKNLF